MKKRLAGYVFIACWVFLLAARPVGLNEVNRFYFYMGEPIGPDLVRLIDQADESIHVGMYYMMTPDAAGVGDFARVLVEAKKRGVNVSVSLEPRPDLDSWSEDAYEYLRNHEIRVRYYKNPDIQHQKAIVVDSEFLYIGSQNITYSALEGQNWESGVIVHSPPMAHQLEAWLEQQK